MMATLALALTVAFAGLLFLGLPLTLKTKRPNPKVHPIVTVEMAK